MSSLRDTWLVARFEVLRAVRTWRALALLLLYAIGYGGASYVFVAILHGLENHVARGLGVATTDTPGALLGTLVKSEMFHEVVLSATGNEALVEQLTTIPPLAIFAMWIGLGVMPFFAASASAEAISIDMGSRALRFEALRTGRLEIVLGRYTGQLILLTLASAMAVVVTWCVGMAFMVGNPPLGLAWHLCVFLVKTWWFSVPFAGIGIAASALTTSPAWARVLAIGTTAGTWLAYGGAGVLELYDHGVLADVLYQLLPQGWMGMLWEPGLGWLPAPLALGAMGVATVGLGYASFQRRDL